MKTNLTHSPYYEPLKDYPESQWLIFGTLTHKYPTPPKTQLERFNVLMTAVGLPNKTEAERLHWVLRLETDLTTNNSEDVKRTHIHFLLSRFKITNGHKHRYTYDSLVTTIVNNWPYGKVDLPPYDPKENGLGYILKSDDPSIISKENEVRLSRSLQTFLASKKKHDSTDPLASEIFHNLKLSGARVSYGDKVIPSLKQRKIGNETNQR